jgi:outer membrane murein-binding lipoprotein Lpp
MKTEDVYGKRDLSEDEVSQKSQHLAAAVHLLELKKMEKDESMKQYASQIKDLESEIKRLSSHVKDKCEYTMVPCEVEKDPTMKMIHYRSMETGMIVKSEPFRREDYQLSMDD